MLYEKVVLANILMRLLSIFMQENRTPGFGENPKNCTRPEMIPDPNDPQNRPKHDLK